jgi:hypothetical protein
MKIATRLVSLLVLAASPALLAQPAPEKKKAEAPAAAAASPPAAQPMGAPKPDPAMDKLNAMIGTWKCEGKMSMGGHDMTMKSTAKFNWDMDKFWVVGQFNTPKSKEMPAYKGIAYYGYDPTTKMYVNFSFDNMGSWHQATSKGMEGNAEEWNGKGMMMGQMMEGKTTITHDSDKQVTIKSSAGGMNEEMVCKK